MTRIDPRTLDLIRAELIDGFATIDYLTESTGLRVPIVRLSLRELGAQQIGDGDWWDVSGVER